MIQNKDYWKLHEQLECQIVHGQIVWFYAHEHMKGMLCYSVFNGSKGYTSYVSHHAVKRWPQVGQWHEQRH